MNATHRQRRRPGDTPTTGGQLYGYGCPECDGFTPRPSGYVRNGRVVVECGACGSVETFEQGYLAGGRA